MRLISPSTTTAAIPVISLGLNPFIPLTVVMTSRNSALSANPPIVLIFSATLTSEFTLESLSVKKGCSSAARIEPGNKRAADSNSPETKVVIFFIMDCKRFVKGSKHPYTLPQTWDFG
jgi:hypothetical protein